MTSQFFLRGIITCLCWIACLRTEAQHRIPEEDEIYKMIDSAMKRNNIPALSVGIIRDGRLNSTWGFGFLSRESPVKVDENSLYQICSDTKKFTAIIVMNLVAEKKLALTEPITSYLGSLLSAESKNKLAGITLENLLLHKSGIPNREPSDKRVDGDPMTIPFTEDEMNKDLNRLTLDFQPGSKFSYSNFGYAIAGYICEKIAGQSYDALVKKYITGKYGMPNTVIYPDKKQMLKVAMPYRKDNRNLQSLPWNMGKMTPAGGIYSNIKDLSMLMIAQMTAYRKYKSKGQQDSLLILTQNTSEGHYGFGLAKVIDEYGTHYGHGGDLDGYGSGYVFVPDRDLGLIMLTSSGGRWFAQLEKQIRIELSKRTPIKPD